MSVEEKFIAFAAQGAPADVKFLPAGLVEPKKQSNADFLRRLRFEVLEILESGDSQIAQENIPFGKRQAQTLLGAFSAIFCMQENKPLNADHRIALQSLYADLTDIRKYYEMKIEVSADRNRALPEEIAQRRVYEDLQRQRGKEGLREIYGLTQKDDDDEIYLDADMPGIPGWLPQSEAMERLGQEHSDLPLAIKRNRTVLEAIHQFQSNLADVYRRLDWDVPAHKASERVVTLSF